MIRWRDTIPPLDRELGAYLLLGCLVFYAIARLLEGATREDREHG